MNTRKQSTGLKKFIRYVNTRVILIENNMLEVEHNQYEYYKALRQEIIQFGETHKLFYSFMLGKIDHKKVMNILGCNERYAFRFMERQRKTMIEFIYEKEAQLFEKFPFSDNSEWSINKEIIME